MKNNEQIPDQFYNSGNQNYVTQGGLPVHCIVNQEGAPVYYQQIQGDKGYQGPYQYANPMMMSPQSINPQTMNSQQINSQRMTPQQMAQQINSQQMTSQQMNPQQINPIYLTNEGLQQEMQQKNVRIQQMNLQPQMSMYSPHDVPPINTPVMYRTPNEQSLNMSNQGPMYNKNPMMNAMHTSNMYPTGQPQIITQPQDNVQMNHSSSDHSLGPPTMSPALRDLLRNVMTNVYSNNGPIVLAKSIMISFMNHKILPDAFISSMDMRKIFSFNPEQCKLIYEYAMQSNQKQNEEPGHHIPNNVQPSRPKVNAPNKTGPAPQIRQPQPSSANNMIINPTISQSNNVRIPQLTMVNNNPRHVAPNNPMSNIRLTHVVRPIAGQNVLKELSDLHEANMSMAPRTVEPEVKQETPEDDDIDFEICGVNIKEEEKLIHKFDQLNQMKNAITKGVFDHSLLHAILMKICNKNKMTVSNESANNIVMILGIALEIKIRNILAKATYFVHHRLKNYEIKGQRHVISNLEQQFEFLEEITTARDPKKADRVKSKTKAETDKKRRQMEEAIIRSNATNEVVMAAMKGRKIENFNQMIQSDSRPGGPQPYMDTLMHQRLRYSAQKQRRIYKRDIIYVFKDDYTLKRYLMFC